MTAISRRQWLRGAGGAMLAIPLLPSLLPKAARAATPPRRFVFVGSRWGRDINRGRFKVNGEARSPWYPHGDPAQIVDGVGVTPLSSISGPDGHISAVFSEAFDDIRDKFSILRGLDGMDIAGNGHGSSMAMTGGGSYPGRIGYGYSIDAVMSESRTFYPEVPFLKALRTSVGEEYPASFSFTSSSGTLARLPSLASPEEVYSSLFATSTMQAREAHSKSQTPVLDAVLGSYRNLIQSGRLSSEDHYKLESHMYTIREIEANLGVALPSCNAQEPGTFDTAEELHDITMDMEVAALACGLTNIVTHVVMQHNSEIVTNRPEAHSAAHGGISLQSQSNRTPVPQWEMNRWVMGQVAKFIKKLDAQPDVDGSLLDNTVLLYGNWEARGYHSFYDMPVVVAGSPDRLAMGQYLDFRPRPLYLYGPAQEIYAGRPYNHLLTTIFKAIGLEPEEYERFGEKGVGIYDGYDLALSDHYKPYLQDRNATLPQFFLG